MTLVLATLSGCLVVAGVWAVVVSGARTHPRLDDTFALLDGRLTAETATEAEGFDRVGAWVRRRSHLGVGDDTRRRLRIVGTSVDRHVGRKAAGALLGLLLPGLVGGWLSWLTGVPVALPALLGIVGAAVGFVLPDLLLRQRDQAVTEDATEALLTFFDLVTLERLANLSGTQALRSAANASSATVFVAIRDALERARLEQRAPYGELQRLGEELRLPALVDIADVMRLDETGASLSGTLRARVRELRDAHLNRLKVEASAVSERMGMLMVVPSLIFGLLFLTPPLLRLIGG
jgi:Flp pilus assembly protein TadB